MKHTILGAGGSIGNALAFELLQNKQDVKLVSRRKYSIPGAEAIRADLASYPETLESIRNSDVVHLVAGLPYNSKVWQEQWPKIMQNVLNACSESQTKLIFFDNAYMYGLVKGKMTEESAYIPVSKKGEIRAKVAAMVENEIYKKNVKALIARSADLYGPYGSKTIVPNSFVIERLAKGKPAQWMVDAGKEHSFTYIPDAAKAMIMLSNDESCFDQIWHLPTHNPGIDGKTFIELSAKELGTSPKYILLRKWMMIMAGLFDRAADEAFEMLYQQEFDYRFDSTKFNKYFKFAPKTYEAGIRETVAFVTENQN